MADQATITPTFEDPEVRRRGEARAEEFRIAGAERRAAERQPAQAPDQAGAGQRITVLLQQINQIIGSRAGGTMAGRQAIMLRQREIADERSREETMGKLRQKMELGEIEHQRALGLVTARGREQRRTAEVGRASELAQLKRDLKFGEQKRGLQDATTSLKQAEASLAKARTLDRALIAAKKAMGTLGPIDKAQLDIVTQQKISNRKALAKIILDLAQIAKDISASQVDTTGPGALTPAKLEAKQKQAVQLTQRLALLRQEKTFLDGELSRIDAKYNNQLKANFEKFKAVFAEKKEVIEADADIIQPALAPTQREMNVEDMMTFLKRAGYVPGSGAPNTEVLAEAKRLAEAEGFMGGFE